MFKTLRASRKSAILRLIVVLTLSTVAVQAQRPQPAASPGSKPFDLIKPLQYRNIGPYRGGRCAAVAGVASQPFVY